jgi:hypothetical protein
MRLGQSSIYTQRLMRSLGELSVALERAATGAPLTVPPSCNEFTEINRLLVALRINSKNMMSAYNPVTPQPAGEHSGDGTQPLPPRPTFAPVFRTVTGSSGSRPFPASGALHPTPASGPLRQTSTSGLQNTDPLPPPLHSLRRPITNEQG